MDVYIEFTAARDRFILVDDKNSSNLPAFPLVFNSVKEAVDYCKQVGWTLKDYGHFNLSQ